MIRAIYFGYSKFLKDVIDIDAYTGEHLSRKDRSIEHIKPKSHGGSSSFENYLVVNKASNNDRGNLPFNLWLSKFPQFAKTIQTYLDKIRSIKYKANNFDNHKYVKDVINTLNRESKGVASFRGNKLDYYA